MKHSSAHATTQRGKSVLSSSLTVTALTAANMAVLFVIQLVVAALFGATGLTDAYFVATALPTLISVALSGSLSVCMIPSYLDIVHTHGQTDAWRVAATFFWATFLGLIALVVVLEVWAPDIARVLAPGFSQPQLDTTVTLMRVATLAVPFLGGASVLGGLYYANQTFVRPGASVVANNATGLALVATFGQSHGIIVVVTALAVGAVVQFCVVLFPLLWREHRMTACVPLSDHRLRHIASLVLPLLLGSAIYKSDAIVSRLLASLLPAGEISYLGYASRIASLLVALGSSGITTVFFPRFASYTAAGNRTELQDNVRRSLTYVSFIMVAVVLLSCGVADQAVSVVLGRGAFTRDDCIGTSIALIGYLGFVYGSGIAGVLANLLYSLQRVRTVVGVGLGGFALFVLLAIVMSRALGYVGVALASSCSSLVNVVVYGVVLRHGGLRVGFRDLVVYEGRLVLAGVGGLALVGCLRMMVGGLFALVVEVAGFGAVYIGLLRLLHCPEASLVLGRLRMVSGRLFGHVKSGWRNMEG